MSCLYVVITGDVTCLLAHELLAIITGDVIWRASHCAKKSARKPNSNCLNN
jgi:hypothetical protein